MAKVMTDDTHYKNIADLIRAYIVDLGLGTEEEVNEIVRIQPRDMPENLRLLFQNYVDVAFGRGEKSEYDRFWDAYQQNGNRADYDGAFYGSGWTTETFKPKYNIKPGGAYGVNLFRLCSVPNVKDALSECGVELDTSEMTNFTFTFYGSAIEKLPVIDMSKSAAANHTFAYAGGLQELSVVMSESTVFDSTIFTGCRGLTNLAVKGLLARSGLNLQWSTNLTRDSLMSIINVLSDTTSGLSITLSKTAVNNAFETSAGATDGSTSAEWAALAGTKTNWTINLV